EADLEEIGLLLGADDPRPDEDRDRPHRAVRLLVDDAGPLRLLLDTLEQSARVLGRDLEEELVERDAEPRVHPLFPPLALGHGRYLTPAYDPRIRSAAVRSGAAFSFSKASSPSAS